MFPDGNVCQKEAALAHFNSHKPEGPTLYLFMSLAELA